MLACVVAAVVSFLWIWPWQVPPRKSQKEMEEEYAVKHRYDNVDIQFLLERETETLKQKCRQSGKRYLVVGGGFVGSRIVHKLLLRGETRVSVFDKVECLEKELRSRVEFIRGDVTNLKEMIEAFNKVDVVFYNAAILCFNKRLKSQVPQCEKVNVGGARNAVSAAVANGVSVLIYTSSSACVQGRNLYSLHANEKTPCVDRENAWNHYSWSKAEAEKIIIDAHSDKLKTGSIRGCGGVYGFHDKLSIDTLQEVDMVPIFTRHLVDFVFVDNLIFAHLLLEQRLISEPAQNLGNEVYCVTDLSPCYFDEMYIACGAVLREIFGETRLIMFRDPPLLLNALAHVVEVLQLLAPNLNLGKLGMVTPAALNIFSASLVFDCSKARRVLGYLPIFTPHEALFKIKEEYLTNRMLPELQT